MRRAQNQSHTHLFRRTDALRTARAHLAATVGGNPRILSFGCSSGEEIATLRYLFPDAELFGCDIDLPALEVASRTAGHLATIFESSADAIAAHGPFHLINCSAVLCLNPPTNIGSEFPGSQFDETLATLDAALHPGGLLVLTNASYRFHATPLAGRYDAVRSDIVSSSGFVDVFAHDGRPFLSRVPKHPRVVFRRGPAFALDDPEELADSVFHKRQAGATPAPIVLQLAPVPARFVCDFEFCRSNLDGLDTELRRDTLETVRLYRFGTDGETGQRSCVIETVWDWGAGTYRRAPACFPVRDDSLLEW